MILYLKKFKNYNTAQNLFQKHKLTCIGKLDFNELKRRDCRHLIHV